MVQKTVGGLGMGLNCMVPATLEKLRGQSNSWHQFLSLTSTAPLFCFIVSTSQGYLMKGVNRYQSSKVQKGFEFILRHPGWPGVLNELVWTLLH